MGKNVVNAVVGTVVTAAGILTGQAWLASVGISMVLGAGANALAGQTRLAEEQGSQLTNSAAPLEALSVIYGETMVGAPFADLRQDPTNKNILWAVYALAVGSEDGSGIEEVTGIWFDGVIAVPLAVNDGDLTDTNVSPNLTRDGNSYLRYAIRRGTDAQYAPGDLTDAFAGTAWPYLTSRGRGIAYTVLRLRFHEDIYTQIPRVTFTVRGQRVWDPRTDTVAWSDNPALCILDYLMSARYGCGVPAEEIDTASFEAAANYCDELVNTTGYTGKRFTTNGSFSTAEEREAVLQKLLLSCRGELVYQGGSFRLVIRQPTTASAYALTEDDIVGDIEFVRAGSSVPNMVTAAYIDPDDGYQAKEVPWPEPDQVNAFLTADNGIPSGITLELPFTNDRHIAQQIGMTALRESREDVTISCAAKAVALQLAVGDVVAVTHSTPGWSGKLFWVAQIGLRPDALVNLVLREYDAGAYSLDTQYVTPTVPGSELPDPFAVIAPPTALVLTSDATTALPTQDGQYVPRIHAAWDASPHAFLDYYEVEFRQNSALLAWQPGGRTRELELYISPVTNGVEYEVRVRAVSTLGRASAWVEDSVLTSTQPGSVTAIHWLGEFASHPADPNANDVYRNTTDGIVYIWDGDSWEVMARDGAPGTGTGLEVRYSGPAAGQNVNATFNPALHVYMQIRRTDQAWPADWAPIVGEDGQAGADGVYFDFRFRVATTQPATPTGTNPSGWSDAPPAVDVEAGEKLWMSRALKNAADGSLLGTWSTPRSLSGPTGQAGVDGITAVLSNDSHVISTNQDGSGGSYAGAETTISVFQGAADVSGSWSYSASASAGVTGSLAGRTYAVTAMSQDRGHVDITATRTGYPSLTVRFALAKSKQGSTGATGTPATQHWLITDAPAIKRDEAGAYTPASITVQGRSVTGSGTPAAYAGRFIIATFDGATWTNRYTSASNQSSYTYALPVGIMAVRVRLYQAGGTSNLLDEEVVPVVDDGDSSRAVKIRGLRWEQYTAGIDRQSLRVVLTVEAGSAVTALRVRYIRRQPILLPPNDETLIDEQVVPNALGQVILTAFGGTTHVQQAAGFAFELDVWPMVGAMQGVQKVASLPAYHESGDAGARVRLSGTVYSAREMDLDPSTLAVDELPDGTFRLRGTGAVAPHSHTIAQVTGLQAALDGKAASSHSHSISQVSGLQAALDGKAAASHSHSIAQVSGLQSALDGKAAASHSHSIAQVSGLQAALDGKAALAGAAFTGRVDFDSTQNRESYRIGDRMRVYTADSGYAHIGHWLGHDGTDHINTHPSLPGAAFRYTGSGGFAWRVATTTGEGPVSLATRWQVSAAGALEVGTIPASRVEAGTFGSGTHIFPDFVRVLAGASNVLTGGVGALALKSFLSFHAFADGARIGFVHAESSGAFRIRSEVTGRDIIFDAQSVERLRILAGGGIAVPQSQAVYLDGGSNTYIQSNSADRVRIVTGGSERFQINNGGAGFSVPVTGAGSFTAAGFYDTTVV